MFLLAVLVLVGVQSVFATTCKCTPADTCWPSDSTWNCLNTTVNGRLILNEPIAEPCYPGPDYSSQSCQYITDIWTNETVISTFPVGYSFPQVDSCPPIDNTTGTSNSQCQLGTAPVYTINATEASDVAAGIKFAQDNNVRLVIKNTGHDIVGRSQGYAGLMIWIKYIQTGVEYQEHYNSSECASDWNGSAFTVGGGYVWGDLYDEAASHDLIVVGGDNPTVGVLGGFLQGGGHGPASHNFGLATDQVLELKVVLASGEVVIANPCQYTDLFTALLGGGGGTYGVVISATIKAYPTQPVIVHTLTLNSIDSNLSTLLNASADIISKYPILSDAGFSGYGIMGDSSPLSPLNSNSGGYSHSFAMFLPIGNTSSSIQEAQSVVNEQILQYLLPYNGTVFNVKSAWAQYSSFEDYYTAVGTAAAAAEDSNSVISSRMFNKESLLNNTDSLNDMLETIFTTTDGGPLTMNDTYFYLALVGGGQVLQPSNYTSVNPAWRETYLLAEIIGEWSDVSAQEAANITDNIVYRKTDAMRALTPGSAAYLNEASGLDPLWKQDFFGSNYGWLKSIKDKYDANGTFYCWRCVGSDSWEEAINATTAYGPLCKTNSTSISS